MPEISVGRVVGNGEFTIDSDTLTKHAIVLGATGSGKTVLCKAFVEELALIGYPIVAIDPKGDIGTLAIASEDLEFRPWSDVEAEEMGIDPDEYAKRLKEKYLKELEKWGISRDKLKAYVNDVHVVIYTPRSAYGIPLSIRPNLDPLPNFDRLVKENPSIAYDVIDSMVSLLIRLAGYSDKNIQEHAFLSKIIEHHWINGEGIDIETLIEEVINPPFNKIGSLTIDAFLPERSRLKLARNLNVLLSHPAYKVWLEGEPIDFDKYFYTKGQISVIDLRFMTTMEEKQFFVGALLNELYRWLLRKGGVSSLRFVLYFDELVGFAPPVSKPPSKTTLLLLVKQGRAFGLGCLLATQNPSDVDYKLLSNANHRFIGRLSTRQDVDKVRRGLELTLDVANTVMRLRPRMFLYHNYEKGKSEVIEVRWLMTYHRGPLQPEEISKLMKKYLITEKGTQEKKRDNVRYVVSFQVREEKESRVSEKELICNSEDESLAIEEELELLSFKPKILPDQLMERLRDFNVKVLSLNVIITKLPLYKVLYHVSVSVEQSPIEHRGVVTVFYDGNNFRVLSNNDDIIGLKELDFGEYKVDEIEPFKHNELLSELLKSRFKIRAFYSPILHRIVFSRRELEKMKEEVRQNILRRMNREIEEVNLDMKIRREEILHKIPILEAELKLKESDYKLIKARAEEIARLKEELKKRRIKLGAIANEYRRIQKEQRELEAEIAELKAKLRMMREELETLEATTREKIELIKQKYKAMLNGSIVELTISPEVKVQRGGYITKVKYAMEIGHRGGSIKAVFDPYKSVFIIGRCTICGADVMVTLNDLRKYEGLPICITCGKPVCDMHVLKCADCGAILCSEHANRCSKCGSVVCKEHTYKCYICGTTLCSRHAIKCPVCGRYICENHAVLCVNKPVHVCTNCVIYKRKLFRKVPYYPE
ncbi:MAG: hypothetical protein DRZ82_03410 [Thermoprotei archaeon]|nr:MAG: hypothetical protein DRZ82_03410 [Thermoprotei archaeon]